MKPNYYTLAAFAVVCGALVGAHYAHIDQLTTLLMSLAGALANAVLPSLVVKNGGAS